MIKSSKSSNKDKPSEKLDVLSKKLKLEKSMNLLLQSDSLSSLPKESPIEEESSKQSNTYSFEDSNTSSFENFKSKKAYHYYCLN
jgi:hypothetical protein